MRAYHRHQREMTTDTWTRSLRLTTDD